MDRSFVSDYKNWIGKSPIDVAQWVIECGGWSRVFPQEEKQGKDEKLGKAWIFSRVRNYFNSPWPTTLKLLNKSATHTLIDSYSKKTAAFFDDHEAWFAEHGAHAEIEYLDLANRKIWYQLSAGGVGYHYKKSHSKPAAIKDDLIMRQQNLPVFKLVSPDRTCGSSEICIHNYLLARKITIADIARPIKLIRGGRSGHKRVTRNRNMINVRNKHVVKPEYRGSYNYADTIISGFSEHNRLDIKTHRSIPGFYVNPDPFSKLQDRRFPELEK